MPIVLTCPGCPTKLSAPESAAGKQIRCPKCKAVVTVPALIVTEEAPVVEAKVVAPAPEPKGKPAAADEGDSETPRKKPSRRDDEGEVDERPRKKKRPTYRNRPRERRTGGAGVVLAVVGVVLIGAFVVGGVLLFRKGAPLDSVTGLGIAPPPEGDFVPAVPLPRTPPPKDWKQYDYPVSGMRAYFPAPPMTLKTTYGDDAPPGIEVPPLENAYTYNTRNWVTPDGIVVIIEVARYKGSIRGPMRDLILGPAYRERGPGRRFRWLGGEASEVVKGNSIMRTAVLDRVIIDATILCQNGPLTPQVAAGFFDNIEMTR